MKEESQEIQHALKRAALEWQTCFDALKDPIAVLETSLIIRRCNRSMRDLIGKPFKEIIGRPYPDLMECSLKENEKCLLRRSRNSLTRESHFMKKRDRWFNVTVDPILDESGCLTGFVHILSDFTETKEAQEAIEESEKQIRIIIESTPVGIRIANDGKNVYANNAFLKMFGYESREEIIGKDAVMFYTPEYRNIVRQRHIDRLRGRPHSTRFDAKGMRKDGSSFEVSAWVTQVEFKGKPSIMIFVVDTSLQKNLEAQLRHAQKMEAIGRLAGGVAHDFNNLLSIINGYVDLALLTLRQEDPLHANLDEIRNASNRATALTRQLLAFSRKQVVAPEILDLNTLIRSLEGMLKRLISEDIELVIILADDLEKVKADQGQMEQVIMNLAVNARDAMPQGGRITIQIANVELDENYRDIHIDAQPGHYVMLVMSDTGSGMDQETQRHIFEPFFTTKEKDKGTGLGLSTVYGIVKQSGGFINVYSEPGKGTTFKVYLPSVGVAEVPKKKCQEADPLPRGTETILLAEDEEPLRRLTAQILKGVGYKVITAANGEEALLLCEMMETPVHLLITDVVMPRMGGGELADRLARIRPGTKVLFMSGYAGDTVLPRGNPAENKHSISKPFERARLIRKVKEVLDGGDRGKVSEK